MTLKLSLYLLPKFSPVPFITVLINRMVNDTAKIWQDIQKKLKDHF